MCAVCCQATAGGDRNRLKPLCVLRTPGHFSPGQYGYGRVRAGVPPATGPGFRPVGSERGSLRQRRSPLTQSFQPPPQRPHGGHRSNSWDPSPSTSSSSSSSPQRQEHHQHHLPGRAYTGHRGPRPKAPPVWAPLYQPGSAYQQPQRGPQSPGSQGPQERPYEPLDASACAGEAVRFQICDNNVSIDL